jgi:hypothetical protein
MWSLEDPIFWEEGQGHESNGRIDLVMLVSCLEDPPLLEEGYGHGSIGRIDLQSICCGEVSVGCRHLTPIDG